MIDKITAVTLNLIKTNFSLVLIFYASGFLSFIAYYRVLGLSYISGDLQLYTELAGKNLLIILQTFIFLVTQPEYFIRNSDALNWTGNAIYVWALVATLLLIIYALFKFVSQTIMVSIQQKTLVTYFQLSLITLMVVITFHIETQAFQAENVLQANNLAKFDERRLNLLNDELQLKQIDYQQRMEIFNKFHEANRVKQFFFSIPQNYDESGNDKRRLNAQMLLILMVSMTAFILMCYRQHILVKWLIYFYAFAQTILIPFNYGILATKYEYPVISLDYVEQYDKDKQKVSHKDRVFLLTESQDNLVIYDRLNLFQIIYIPQSAVIHLEQNFSSSPFSNCSNGGFKPCELYANKQSLD